MRASKLQLAPPMLLLLFAASSACVIADDSDAESDAGAVGGGSSAGAATGGDASSTGGVAGRAGAAGAGATGGSTAGTSGAGATGGVAGTSTGGAAGLAGTGGSAGSTGGAAGAAGGTTVIDDAGGEVVASDPAIAGAGVVVPAQALSQATPISVSPGSDVASVSTRGPAVKFGPDGTTFAVPVTITVPLSDATGQIIILKRNDQTGVVQYLEDVSVDAGSVSAQVTSFSTMQAAACTDNGCGGCTPLPSLGLACGTCGTAVCDPGDANSTICNEALCNFANVSVGDGHSCTTRSDGSGSCFGFSAFGEVEIPPGVLPTGRLIAGHDYTCALDPAGSASCWGASAATVPPGPFDDLVVGNQWACGLRSADGGIDCWGSQSVAPPSTGFTALALAGSSGCAVNAGGTIECFGSAPPTFLPTETFSSLVGFEDTFCGLTTSNNARCFGALTGGLAFLDSPTTEQYRAVATAGSTLPYAVCLIRMDNSIECHTRESIPLTLPSGEFISIDGGSDRFCAVRSDRQVLCWGRDNGSGAAQPLQRRYSRIAVGSGAGCALADGGLIECWGSPGGISNPIELYPAGAFAEVRAATQYACARDAMDGQLSCWSTSATANTPTGSFTAFDVSRDNAADVGCGVRDDGTLSCWGFGFSPSLPSGTYGFISLAGSQACALRSDDTLDCFRLTGGTEPVPSGAFTSVCHGGTLNCGVRQGTGALDCWDKTTGGAHPIVTPPPGTFSKVVCTAGDDACALGTDNSIVCFGTSNSNGQLSAPSGSFQDVDFHGTEACGVRLDGSVSCWGNLGRSP